MRVFSKKAFEFSRGEERVKVLPLQFSDIPDWAAEDQMFKWAQADGDIEIIQSPKEEAKVEKAANEKKKK